MATPTLVSSDKNGNALPGRSGLSSVSADGNLVTFTNLTGDGTASPFYQVYLKDLATGDLTAVGTSLNEQTQFSQISGDGSTIVFEANSQAFFGDHSNAQIYLYDVAGGGVTLVTKSTSNTVSDGSSPLNPSISNNGGVVAFDSTPDDLVTGISGLTNPNFGSDHDQVYIHTAGGNQLISKIGTTAFNDNSWNAYVSANGQFVAFESFASNIGLGASGHQDEVYLYNVATKKLTLVSKTANGTIADGNDNGAPALSATGRYVAFISAATNLVAGASNGTRDQIYWKDTVTGQLKLVSAAADGTPGNGNCSFITPEGVNYVSISADGRFVTFASNSTNLVSGAGTNNSGTGHNVVYVKDMVTGAISAVSQNTIDSVDPSISSDGSSVTFTNNSAGYSPNFPFSPLGGQIYLGANELVAQWKKAVSGDWALASNWNPAGVPIAVDDVLITVPGTYTVTSSANQKIHTLTTAANATLTLKAGVLDVTHGTGPADQNGALAGVVNILKGAELEIGSGTLNNTGAIFMSGTGASKTGTSFLVIDNDVDLQGGGTISLSNTLFHNQINSPNGFTNVDNTIEGAGVIFGSVTNGAQGTIDATGLFGHSLAINDQTANPVVNDGVLESTASGGLIVQGKLTNNGQVLAKAGTVYLHGDVSGTGSATISDGAELILGGAYSSSVGFDANAVGTLRLDEPDKFTGTITNLNVGDTIELLPASLSAELDSASVAHTQISGSTLDVTMSNGNTLSLQLQAAVDYSSKCFTVSTLPDGGVGLTFADASPQVETDVPGSGYGNPYIDSLIWGWGAWDTSAPITYWFGGASDFASDAAVHGSTLQLNAKTALNQWTAASETAVQSALAKYSAVCGLTFQQAASAADANIVMWAMPTIRENPNLLGESELPDARPDGQEWIYFNSSAAGWANLKVGGDGLWTITHELGHALGLAHPHDGGLEPDGTTFPGVTTASDLGDNGQNQSVYSEMSYNRGWNGAPWSIAFGGQSGPGAFDIAALQQLYGANTSDTGAHIFQLPKVNIASTGWSCIWNGSTNNTISNAGSAISCVIDLRAAPFTGANAGGYISHDLGIGGGFTIANGAHVDNAVGGSGNDVIIANGETDTADGGSGFNTFEVSGSPTAYTVTGSAAAATVKTGGVTDTLTNVQAVAFSPAAAPFPGAGGVLDATGLGLDVLTPIKVAVSIEDVATLELFSSDSGRVTFKPGTESLILDKSTLFTGQIAGFGGSDTIDLRDVKSLNATKTYNATTGILTVNDHAGDIATIKFVGTVNLSITDDGHGGTLVTDPPPASKLQNIANDPPHGFDQPSIAFGGRHTLAHAENRTETGAILEMSNGRHEASIALLGNYIAGSFATSADGLGGTPVTEGQTGLPPLLSHPHG
jgi:serralysin